VVAVIGLSALVNRVIITMSGKWSQTRVRMTREPIGAA